MTRTSLTSLLRTGYELGVRAASALQSPLLLTLRLYWGWQFCQTGWGKLMHLSATAEFFGSLGIPLPTLNAALAGTTECVGGLLLLLGLASRLAALPLIFTMLVAYGTADIEAVRSVFADPDKFVTAAPFLFLLVALLVLIFGPGAFSLDRLIARKLGVPFSPPLQPPASGSDAAHYFVREVDQGGR